jgi:hypothetical protein
MRPLTDLKGMKRPLGMMLSRLAGGKTQRPQKQRFALERALSAACSDQAAGPSFPCLVAARTLVTACIHRTPVSIPSPMIFTRCTGRNGWPSHCTPETTANRSESAASTKRVMGDPVGVVMSRWWSAACSDQAARAISLSRRQSRGSGRLLDGCFGARSECPLITSAIVANSPGSRRLASEDEGDACYARWQLPASARPALAGNALEVIHQDQTGSQVERPDAVASAARPLSICQPTERPGGLVGCKQ